MSHQCVLCSLQCVTARRPAAASTSNADIFHGCLVVDRHREHVGSNIRCWLWLPARWRRCQSSPFTHCKEGTHWRTCGASTSRSSSLTSGPKTARTWIQSITLFEVSFRPLKFINYLNQLNCTLCRHLYSLAFVINYIVSRKKRHHTLRQILTKFSKLRISKFQILGF